MWGYRAKVTTLKNTHKPFTTSSAVDSSFPFELLISTVYLPATSLVLLITFRVDDDESLVILYWAFVCLITCFSRYQVTVAFSFDSNLTNNSVSSPSTTVCRAILKEKKVQVNQSVEYKCMSRGMHF